MKRCLNCMELYEERNSACPFCHYVERQEDDSELLQPGTILDGRYILGCVRSKGEASFQYVGWDALFERKVLIQEFFPRYLVKRREDGALEVEEEQAERFREYRDIFLKERKNLIRLYREPDIGTVYSAFLCNETAYATMQYTEAVTLGDYIEEQGEIPLSEALYFLGRAAVCVEKVHRTGCIHGDLTPQSFQLSADMRQLVLSGFADPWLLSGGTEEEEYAESGCWTDIRALAMLFCEMVAGKEAADTREALVLLNRLKKDLPEQSLRALKSALTSRKDYGIQTIAQLQEALFRDSRTMQLAAPEAGREGLRGFSEKKIDHLWWAVILAAGVLLLLSVSLWKFTKAPEGGKQRESAVPTYEQATPDNADSGDGSSESSL